MKKVCHMTSAHPSSDIRIFNKECVTLSRAGYKVFLAAHGEEYTEQGVSVQSVGQAYSSRMKRMLFASRNIYRKALEIDADIYHFHDPELLPYALNSKKEGKYVVYDSHQDVPRQILAKTWIPKPIRKLVSKCYERYEKHAARQFDYVITATDHIKEIFEKYGCRAESVKNYPLLDDIQCNNDNYLSRPPILCYAGGITEQRGITNILRAIEDLNVKLDMAGDIETGYRKELESMEGWKCVNYLGYLDRSGINKLYNKSRVGLVVLKDTPNHRYSLPIKMFEYMAAGIPVIASDFPIWKNIIDEVQCGICVDPENIIAIQSAIRQLLTDENQARKMGENGRKAVCSIYSWNIEAEKLLDVYKKIG